MDLARPLLQVRGLSVVYPTQRGDVQAVDSVYLDVPVGSRLGLVGESGCGKSTVLYSILRLIQRPGRVTSGEIEFGGMRLDQLPPQKIRGLRGSQITMIFQDPQSTLNPVFPVGEQIRESLQLHHVIPGSSRLWPFNLISRRQERERVLQVMQEVGIASPMDRYAAYPHQFSGGMQQRALIALALVCNPALILADEPTTALDVTIQAQILDLMLRINGERHTTIVLVTHDLGVAAEFCDTIAVMYAGRIVEHGAVEDVVNNPQHPYTRGLLSCRPQIDRQGEKVHPIPGNVPDMLQLPPGCAFAPRCPLAREACEQGPLPMIQTQDGRRSRCLEQVQYERNPSWTWTDTVRL